MKKRILSTLLSAALILSLFSVTALADGETEDTGASDPAIVTIESGTVKAGESIELAVRMRNVPEFAGFTFRIIYDTNTFTLNSFSDGYEFTYGTMTLPVSYLGSASGNSSTDNGIYTRYNATAIAVNGAYGEDDTTGYTLFTFNMTAKEDAVNGDYELYIAGSRDEYEPLLFDVATADLPVVYVPGTLTVTGGTDPVVDPTVTFSGENATVALAEGETATLEENVATVGNGNDLKFTVTADAGYEVTSVTANGEELTAENGVYTLPAVTADTTVEFTTRNVTGDTYQVTFATDANTSVNVTSETDVTAVPYGGSVSFTVTAVDGYKVGSVTANGTVLKAVDGVYTLSPVTSDVTVTVTGKAAGSTTWDGTIATSFDSGSGTADDPYIISTANELAYLASVVNDGNTNYTGAYYELTEDLNLNGQAWTPIGQNEGSACFSGVLDGGGHTISGLSVEAPIAAGLFGYVKSATIQNLVISGTVKGTGSGTATGGLIGFASTSVTLINCGNEADVTGTQNTGGLIGEGTGTTANSCVLSGCYNAGTITTSNTSTSYGVGGLAGYLQMGVALTNCYNAGTTSGKAYHGGLVGYVYNLASYPLSAENCFTVGTMSNTSSTRVRALFGKLYSLTNLGTVANNYFLTTSNSKDRLDSSIAITAADLVTLAEKLGSAFNATTGGTVTFSGEHAQVLINGAETAATSAKAAGYPALAWEGVTTREGDGVAVFTVTADEGYAVESVKNGETELTADANGVYALTGITSEGAAVTITTKEAAQTYDVTFTVGENAAVNLTEGALTDGKIAVTENGSVSFTVTADVGYEVASVTANGTALAAVDGVYTLSNVIEATEVTITAREKSAYTVSLVPSLTEVEANGSFTVDVVVDPGENGAFAAWDIGLTYDKDLFTYVSATGNSTVETETTDGTLQLKATNDDDFTVETTIATLTFTATGAAGNAGSFTFTDAKIAKSVDALEQDAVTAATTGTSVTITQATTYTVTFYAEDGTTPLTTITVSQDGGKLTSEQVNNISIPEVTGKTFQGWQLNGTIYTAAELVQQTITADVTVTAVYQNTEYTVTHTGITGADTATYFDAYTGTIEGYSSSYTYTVTVRDVNTSRELYTVASTAIDSTGKFTIPANIITGNVTLEVSKSLGDVTIAVYQNYVAGLTDSGTPYSLIVVYGTAAGYTYNGADMYRVAAYDGDEKNTVTGGKAYAYMVAGTLTTDQVQAVLDVADATNTAPTIANSDDVNGTGTTDIADAQAVRDCYNGKNADVANLMATYLRADRDHSHEVDMTDVSIVMNKLTR